jgi:hypothetical protein
MVKCIFSLAMAALLLLPLQSHAQGYSVRAIDAKSGKVLKDFKITMRYNCIAPQTGTKTVDIHCEYVSKKTGSDGIAHFVEASSQSTIDAFFPSRFDYEAGEEARARVVPGMETIKFHHMSLGEVLYEIFRG